MFSSVFVFHLIKFVSFCCYRFSWWINIFVNAQFLVQRCHDSISVTRPNTTRLDQHVFCDWRQKQVARVKGSTMTSGPRISIKRDKNKSLDYTQTCRSRGTTKGVLGTRNHSIGLREFLVANMIDWLIDWVRLNVPPTHYMGTGFYGSNDPTNSVKALKEHTKVN